ncbi:hypothetical protein AKJ66_02795 [candidate division MSBL1 archaeon SCGC-AAA259E22]|uniref:Uncharacterized protein n=2 Tax=candidate division MSBL1 TaxID=215777 RepID=A0A133U4L4_9EURY|nr:hypothetical protein AKJ61_03540 [candidate division MSBL1 archaeon SCGC-AAA259B11]KXA93100.1 hypothetical protein AKJ66_02795 [candidate division MSBL1 archaeon SCGC-AAA259E22]
MGGKIEVYRRKVFFHLARFDRLLEEIWTSLRPRGRGSFTPYPPFDFLQTMQKRRKLKLLAEVL